MGKVSRKTWNIFESMNVMNEKSNSFHTNNGKLYIVLFLTRLKSALQITADNNKKLKKDMEQ